MRDVPLHESHLLEAVRRRVLTSDQMEQVLAIARATPAGGAVRDVGWATVVQGLIAGAAVMGSAMGILIDASDHGPDLGMAAYGVVGVVASLAISHFLHRYTWGRVPGSIIRAGASVWSFAVALGLLSLVTNLHRYAPGYDGYGTYDYSGVASFHHRLNVAYALASLAAIGVSFALWRFKRCAPSLGFAACHALMLVLPFMDGSSSREEALMMLAAGGGLFTLAFLRDRFARGAVDGTFWVYPVAMFPMGCAAMLRIDRDEAEVFVWLPLALALGAAAHASGRRFPLLFSAVAMIVFPAFALAEAHAPAGIVIGALVVSAALVAVAVQVIRTRDLGRAAPAGDPPSIWG